MAVQEGPEERSEDDPSFDPFKRHDQYGLEGAERQPIWEYLRLAVIALTILPLKIIGCVACLVGCYLVCKFSFLVPAHTRSAWVVSCGRVFVRMELFCLGFVTVTWKTVPDTRPKHILQGVKVAGVVSNHCSWADILVHMSRSFPSFVARASTKDLLWVGLISQHMDCLFVERELKSANTQGVSGKVKQRMEAAAKESDGGARLMLLFPEGTTTNGLYLLPFKSGAFLAGAPVQPVLIQYGKGRASPAWESIDIKWHLFLMMCSTHSVTAYELPVYIPSDEEKNDALLYAQNVRQYMLSFPDCVALKPSDSNLPDKRAYHAKARCRGVVAKTSGSSAEKASKQQ
ncbi:hypothetical protein ABBQ38_000636 [Trebouxia sp. C0009 RCD-2024]